VCRADLPEVGRKVERGGGERPWKGIAKESTPTSCPQQQSDTVKVAPSDGEREREREREHFASPGRAESRESMRVCTEREMCATRLDKVCMVLSLTHSGGWYRICVCSVQAGE